MIVLRDRTCEKGTKVKQGHRSRALINRSGALKDEERTPEVSLSRERTWKKGSCLQARDKNHLVCGILSWQPRLIHIASLKGICTITFRLLLKNIARIPHSTMIQVLCSLMIDPGLMRLANPSYNLRLGQPYLSFQSVSVLVSLSRYNKIPSTECLKQQTLFCNSSGG